MRLRLYLDEDVTPELARLARSAGEDVISVHEIGAGTLGDEPQLLRATRDGRAILTYNYAHFLRLAGEWSAAGRHHAGIVISYRQYSSDEVGALWQAVRLLIESVDAENLVDAVIPLDSFRPRQR